MLIFNPLVTVEFLLAGDASVCKATFQLNELHAAVLAPLLSGKQMFSARLHNQ
jgi:hypothetical protein